jgi:hypothetical protein
MRATIIMVVLVATSLLSACSENVVRPDPKALTLGQSHYSDVIKLLGTPKSKNDTATMNGEPVRSIQYFAFKPPTFLFGLIPQKTLTYWFFNDVMVGENFVSSFSEDSTDYDRSKTSDLVPGKSSRTDVIAALGKPSGEGIYPMVKEKNGTALYYFYATRIDNGVYTQTTHYNTVVELDDKGIVSHIFFNGIEIGK